MRFAGSGLVKFKGLKIANFVDGYFSTDDPKVIDRLRALGFSEAPAEKPAVFVDPEDRERAASELFSAQLQSAAARPMPSKLSKPTSKKGRKKP